MILYAIHYKGQLTSSKWRIINICKDIDESIYWKNYFKNNSPNEGEYDIIEIDTNLEDSNGMIYYYNNYDS